MVDGVVIFLRFVEIGCVEFYFYCVVFDCYVVIVVDVDVDLFILMFMERYFFVVFRDFG